MSYFLSMRMYCRSRRVIRSIGSLKLKYYGGKSLFKGLWEPAGERKRAGVIEVRIPLLVAEETSY